MSGTTRGSGFCGWAPATCCPLSRRTAASWASATRRSGRRRPGQRPSRTPSPGRLQWWPPAPAPHAPPAALWADKRDLQSHRAALRANDGRPWLSKFRSCGIRRVGIERVASVKAWCRTAPDHMLFHVAKARCVGMRFEHAGNWHEILLQSAAPHTQQHAQSLRAPAGYLAPAPL